MSRLRFHLVGSLKYWKIVGYVRAIINAIIYRESNESSCPEISEFLPEYPQIYIKWVIQDGYIVNLNTGLNTSALNCLPCLNIRTVIYHPLNTFMDQLDLIFSSY